VTAVTYAQCKKKSNALWFKWRIWYQKLHKYKFYWNTDVISWMLCCRYGNCI
jgi:hypothetical protein